MHIHVKFILGYRYKMEKLFVAIASILLTACASVKCGESSFPPMSQKISWIESEKIIYIFSIEGELLEFKFDSEPKRAISGHQFKYQSYFEMSSNGQYVVYGGTLKDESKLQLYIYDEESKEDRLLFEMPKYDSLDIEFSPDSKSLAILNVSYPHRQELSKEGIFIFDLSENENVFLGYPDFAVIRQENVMGSELVWSKNGEELYVAFNGRESGKHRREYYQVDLESMSYKYINGYYDKDRHTGYHFIVDGRKMDHFGSDYLQWQRNYDRSESKNRKVSAYIDGGHHLKISTANGNEIVIAKGEYTQCEGVTIGIVGWIEEDRYLIYRIGEITYIYGIQENRSAVLFNAMNSWYAWGE